MSRASKSNVRPFPRIDKNGIPILDPPHEANKLPRRCAPGAHVWIRVGRRFVRSGFDGDIYEVEYRCDKCTAKSVETEIEE